VRKIRLFADRILSEEAKEMPDHSRTYVERMSLAAKRMQKLIDDFLAFSQTVAMEKIFESTDLNMLLEDVKAEFSELLDEKNGKVTSSRCGTECNTLQFRQLMMNLIGNSISMRRNMFPCH